MHNFHELYFNKRRYFERRVRPTEIDNAVEALSDGSTETTELVEDL